MKVTQGKPRLAKIPPYAKACLALALESGDIKYEAGDYLNGGSKTDYLSGAERHLDARKAGEVLDPETGVPHAAMAMACLAIFLEYEAHGIGDDLIRGFAHPTLARTPEVAAAFTQLRAQRIKRKGKVK